MRTNPQSSPMARDVQNVVSDAQELLRTVQSEGESRMAEVRSKVQDRIESARQTAYDLQRTVADGAELAVKSTDAYVHANPWTSIGIGAAVGMLIGFLVARR